jgi:hypothetical protein
MSSSRFRRVALSLAWTNIAPKSVLKANQKKL